MMYLLFSLISILYLSVNALPFADQLNEPTPFNGTKWVVLCAGGNTWDNYRHQANVYHAYQIVKSHGIPQKNIIVFHYDDLAYNKVNPTPGIVVNTLGGPDVYHGVPKDYIGHEVNPINFVGVLKGDKTLKKNDKKVLESGPNDHVYIYFIDHGDDDVILFPTEYLYGEELNEALKYMHQNHMFAKLVFNMETCHSGSMFEKLLPKDINVYVTTSTKPDELSYVTYYDELRKTYLGDYYSGAWLENSETQDLDKETLQAQFEYLSKNVTTSTPQQYGDVSIAKLPVSQFFGNKPTGYIPSKPVYNNDADREVVNPRDIPVLLAQKNIASTNDINEKQKYAKELETILKGREYVDNVFNEYVNSIQHLMPNICTNAILHTKQELNNRHCYRQLVDTFHQNCFNLNQNEYLLRKLNIFVNICEQMRDSSDADIAVNRLIQHCDRNVDSIYSQIV